MTDDYRAVYLPRETHDPLIPDARPLDQHPAAVYLASLSEGSRRTVFQSLQVVVHVLTGGQLDLFSLDWSLLRYQHTAAVRAQLAEQYQPATANKILAALRRVLYHAWKLGQMSAEDYYRARDVENVKGETIPAGRDLSVGEIAALMAACESDPTPAGVRDAAIIALMYATGVRRASVIKLDVKDYDPVLGALHVREAKRGKEYMTYLSQGGAQHALADWLTVRGDEPGPLFWPVNKGGNRVNRRLSTQAIYNMLVKRGKQAGVDHFSPHDLRRTLAGDLLDAGADIVTVQKMLGHASVETTARYDRRPEEAKRKAANLIHVPYQGRRPEPLDEV